ncbi:MAG TPA: glycosyltransferase family 4 protein [Actinomycetales bacterium]|nr:glycosyltransferase family 4 protein [Actinomycetales bacterium]
MSILVPRTDVGGGARILFEHANRLTARGHDVVLYSHLPRPTWFELTAGFVEVAAGKRLTDDVCPCDVIICGYWSQVTEASQAQIAPVIHFEQGDFHLFEELSPATLKTVGNHLAQADATSTVSNAAARLLWERYATAATVLPNSVDHAVFTPDGPRPALPRPYVLCVGWDGNQFKGIDDARAMSTMLRSSHPQHEVVWVTPRQPVGPVGDIGRVVVAPEQAQLASLYRGAEVYVCASYYESFPLPGLEAMSSGTPVVATSNVGSLEYCRDGENSLVVPIGSPVDLHAAVSRLLDDDTVSRRCRRGGLTTASSYSWEVTLDALESLCIEVASSGAPAGSEADWTPPPCSLVPVDRAAEAKLNHVLGRTGAATVRVPVARSLFEGHDVMTWETIASREEGEGTVCVFAPHRSDQPGRFPVYQAGVDLFLEGRFADAADAFAGAWPDEEDLPLQGSLVRWLALCFNELDRPADALDLLLDAHALFLDNPDYVYLISVIAARVGHEVDFSLVDELLRVAGQGTRYLDWFVHPCGAFRA